MVTESVDTYCVDGQPVEMVLVVDRGVQLHGIGRLCGYLPSGLISHGRRGCSCIEVGPVDQEDGLLQIITWVSTTALPFWSLRCDEVPGRRVGTAIQDVDLDLLVTMLGAFSIHGESLHTPRLMSTGRLGQKADDVIGVLDVHACHHACHGGRPAERTCRLYWPGLQPRLLPRAIGAVVAGTLMVSVFDRAARCASGGLHRRTVFRKVLGCSP